MSVVLGLYAPFDPQHLSECILIAMTHLKLLPSLPVGLGCPGVAHLGTMAIDCASTLNLTQLGLQLSVLQTHAPASGRYMFGKGFKKNKPKCVVQCEH